MYKCFREVFTVTVPTLALCTCLTISMVKTGGSAVFCCGGDYLRSARAPEKAVNY